MRKKIRLYWSRSKPNFGDRLSPLIVEAVSGKPVCYASLNRCDLVAIGSLLNRVRNNWWNPRINIWGTGFISRVSEHRTRHNVHAIRGRESLELLSNVSEGGVALGDPGLLADRIVRPRNPPGKAFSFAVIPHYKDREDPRIRKFLDDVPRSVEVDIFSDPEEILSIISRSDIVLSSAMHGLIAADSLSVPNQWIKLSSDIRGDDFKFHDYYSAFGIKPEPVLLSPELCNRVYKIIDSYSRPGLDELKKNLEKSFPCIY